MNNFVPIFVYSSTVSTTPQLRQLCVRIDPRVFVCDTIQELILSIEIFAYELWDNHPTTKLKANLAKIPPDNKKKKLAVLISTGAYCPIHRMHIENFNVAKKYLEENHNYVIVAGYISPSHDHYINGKLSKQEFISSYHRLKMCALASQDDWIEADPWESSRSGFVSFPKVAQHLDDYLCETFPRIRIEIIFLCGADLIVRCNMSKVGKHWVVATGRPGFTEQVQHVLNSKPPKERQVYWLETNMEDLSSTKIRNALIKNEPLDGLTFASVIKYLKDNVVL